VQNDRKLRNIPLKPSAASQKTMPTTPSSKRITTKPFPKGSNNTIFAMILEGEKKRKTKASRAVSNDNAIDNAVLLTQ
jgi:hypothetical protein